MRKIGLAVLAVLLYACCVAAQAVPPSPVKAGRLESAVNRLYFVDDTFVGCVSTDGSCPSDDPRIVKYSSATATQNPPPVPPVPRDPFETGWNISVNGGYSSIANAATNNGFFFSTGIRLSQHWGARGDVFVLTDPAITTSLAKGEYRFSAQHLFKGTTTPTVKNMEFFVNAGVGSAHYTDPKRGGTAKVAWGVGGGFDVKISDKISIRPLDINYIRSSLIGGGRVIGNHLQFAAGLGLRL